MSQPGKTKFFTMHVEAMSPPNYFFLPKIILDGGGVGYRPRVRKTSIPNQLYCHIICDADAGKHLSITEVFGKNFLGNLNLLNQINTL